MKVFAATALLAGLAATASATSYDYYATIPATECEGTPGYIDFNEHRPPQCSKPSCQGFIKNEDQSLDITCDVETDSAEFLAEAFQNEPHLIMEFYVPKESDSSCKGDPKGLAAVRVDGECYATSGFNLDYAVNSGGDYFMSVTAVRDGDSVLVTHYDDQFCQEVLTEYTYTPEEADGVTCINTWVKAQLIDPSASSAASSTTSSFSSSSAASASSSSATSSGNGTNTTPEPITADPTPANSSTTQAPEPSKTSSASALVVVTTAAAAVLATAASIF